MTMIYKANNVILSLLKDIGKVYNIFNFNARVFPHGNADMAKLADAHDSGSCGKPCRFKSCYPHQKERLSKRVGVLFVWRKMTGLEPLCIFALKKQFGKLFLVKMGER